MEQNSEYLAIRLAAEYLQDKAEWEPYEVIQALTEKGIATDLAEAAVRIGPIPFGRVILKEMDVAFPVDYLRFNAAGELTASGKLLDHPVFVAGTDLANNMHREPIWQTFALVSAEVKFVDRELHEARAKLPIEIGPIVYFSDPPSNAAIDRVDAYLANRQ